MILGFTGTRQGMTTAQRKTVLSLIKRIDPDKVLHGDCTGSDAEFHAMIIAYRGGILAERPRPVIAIRPSDRASRAYCEGAELIYPPKSPLDRDREIAKDSDSMIATPKGFEEEVRSGTWATIRYFRLYKNKTLYIVQPDGNII